jgi:hypothetical protein
MLRLLITLAVTATLCTTTAALAADPKPGARPGAPNATPKPQDRANELFDQAAAAFDAGRYAEAQEKLEQVWALKKTYDVAGNLGVVEVKLGKYPQAAEHLAWALQHFPLTEPPKARRGFEQELEKARAQSGALRVVVSVEGAEVSVNGRPAGKAPVADEVFVEPGMITVAASAPGYEAAQQTIRVEKGGSAEVKLTLGQQRRSLVPGIVLGSAGVAAAAAGIGLMVAYGGKKSSATTLSSNIQSSGGYCLSPSASLAAQCTQLHSQTADGATFHRAAIGVLVGGAASLAAAGAYFLWPSSAASRTSGVTAIPVVTLAGGGVTVQGSF